MKRSAVKLELFADAHQRDKLDQIGDPLARIDELVDFRALAAHVDKVSPRGDSKKGGRPALDNPDLPVSFIIECLEALAKRREDMAKFTPRSPSLD